MRLRLTGWWCLAVAVPVPAQVPPAVAEPEAATSPVTDREETGAATHMLPDRVELMALPGGEAAGAGRAGLFPPELWPEPPDVTIPAVAPPAAPAGGAVSAVTFGAGPPPAVYDPLGLIDPAAVARLDRLMRESLGGRGTFQCCVTLLDPDRPGSGDPDAAVLLPRWFGHAPSLLVLYYPGKPEQTRAFFSREAVARYSGEALQQVIDFGRREAERMDSAAGQLQRFCCRTAARLDRLHRQGATGPEEGPSPAPAPERNRWWAVLAGGQAAALLLGGGWWWHRRRGQR